LQVRRYARSAGLPIAILTDFQEFAIYDARVKTSGKDTASTARIEYLTYDQYEEKFEELYNRISWDAVDLGHFDSYFESAKDKRGTASIDEELLEMIERWRVLLAEDIALHNEEMSEEELTSCVQKIIDRLLFLRICEDKEIEPIQQLQKLIEKKTQRGTVCDNKADGSGKESNFSIAHDSDLAKRASNSKNKDTVPPSNVSIYDTLKTLFGTCESRFNAGLFKNDEALNALKIQDKTLGTIISELYYPSCEYEFSVIPVEILGSIYERFLGKIIRFKRKTRNGHSVEIIEKSEVQKAGGVYYTPSYIVDYIVRKTIGKKIEGAKNLEEVARLKVCDPACGSGSFLVGAYQYLLDWHLDHYYKEERRVASEKMGVIYKDASTQEWKLDIEEKRRILLTHIFGVDIDAQAVEVTKLSLFLKLLENEGSALSKHGQASLFKTSELKKILPSMHENIKCGNSLVSDDDLLKSQKGEEWLTLEEQKKLNIFNWKNEFASVFDDGGFDCIIGNPPYVKEYTNKGCFNILHNSPYYQGKMDLWYFFGVLAVKFIKENGLAGFIAPNNWNTNEGASLFRNFVLENAKILKYVDFGNYKVFKNASIQTMIYIIKKTRRNEKYLTKYSRLNNEKASIQEVVDFLNDTKGKKTKEVTKFQAEIVKHECMNNYILFLDSKIVDVLRRIKERSDASFESGEIIQGIVGAPDESFLIGDLSLFDDIEKAFIKPYYTGLVDRYLCKKTDQYIIYLSDKNFKDQKLSHYPNFEKHFAQFKKVLKDAKIKYKTPNKPYYYLHRERDESFFKEGVEKIISQGRTLFPRFYYTCDAFYPSRALFVIKTSRFNLKSLVAILNSSVICFWLRYKGKMQGNNFQVDKVPLLSLPLLRTTKEDDEKLSSLVDEIIGTHKQLNATKFDSEKKFLAQRIDLLDRKINTIVCDLYGVSEEEIR